MRNPYKRTDIFICNYAGHAKFENKVSCFHVMYSKKCFPQGCLMFKWSCAMFERGKNCVRGFNYVGRLCDGCTWYEDEKVHYQPSINVDKNEFAKFQSEIEEFEDWLLTVQDRQVDFWCEVDSIKPGFIKTITGKNGQIRLQGYLLIFKRGFIGATEMEDYFYAYVSPGQQEKLQIAPGDKIDARGILTLDESGRILLAKIWHIDFEYRSGDPTWNNSRALVARQTARQFDIQLEKCLQCPHGALVDVNVTIKGENIRRRELYCLEGIKDQELCSVQSFELLDACENVN